MQPFENNETGEIRQGFVQKFEQIKDKLNLSAEQEQKIQQVIKDFRNERKEIKQGEGDDVRGQMQEARHDVKEKIASMLSDDQRKVFHESLKALRQS